MAKTKKYKWGELEVNVTEVPVFDTNTNKYIRRFPIAKVQEIDFEVLTNEIIKRGNNTQVPFAISFNEKWR